MKQDGKIPYDAHHSMWANKICEFNSLKIVNVFLGRYNAGIFKQNTFLL